MKNIITLALIAIAPFAQAECCGKKAFDKMNQEQRAATGIDKLSVEERAELSTWIAQKAKRGKRARFHNNHHRHQMRARPFVIKEVDAENGIIKTEKGMTYRVGPKSGERAKGWKAGDRVLRIASKQGRWVTLKNLASNDKARAQKVRSDVVKTITDAVAS